MLVDRFHRRSVLGLSALAAVSATVTAGATLINADLYEGVLSPDLLLGSLGFDVVSLLVSIVLLGCVAGLAKGRDRLWLLWTGLQGYLLYAYAVYAFGRVYTPLYFLYIIIIGLSAYALAIFWRSVNPQLLRHVQMVESARRAMSTALFLITGAFAAAWVVFVVEAIAQAIDLPASSVIVIDLAFALPMLAIVGVLLLRHHPMGYLLAPGVFAMSAAITLGVAAGEFVRPLMGGGFNLRQTVPYLLPGVFCAVLAGIAFQRIKRAIPRIA